MAIMTRAGALLLLLTPSAYSAPVLTPQDRAVVQKISDTLKAVRHVQGSFMQTNPDGSLSEGLFFIRRPGRMRFEYSRPGDLLVVADGTWIIVREDSKTTPDRYPLKATPLNILLASDMDLLRDTEIRKLEHLSGVITLTLADPGEETPGEVTLVFSIPDLALQAWHITDAQGLQTKITLQNMRYGIKANKQLFIVKSDLRPEIGRNRKGL